ncbi:MAG: Smr/MutS family protein [Thermacetogeniaceae bacterium]
MKNCVRCGNEILDIATSCHFCGARQGTGKQAGPCELVRTVNIEAGMPLVEEGLARLEGELTRARQAGVRVLRVIHGWGSTGTGGALRDACRAFLNRKLYTRQIAAIIYGDDYSPSTDAGHDLMNRCPELRSSMRSDNHNPGITFIVL